MIINIITQARIGSSRLPNKVLLTVGPETILSTHLRRLKRSQIATNIVVATTYETGAQKIIDIAKSEGCLSFQGSTEDVLDRFYQACLKYPCDIIVRVTSDCPLNDGALVDEVLKYFINTDTLDYASNANPPTFADGLDVEVFTFKSIQKAWNEAKLSSEREHVTPYIWKNPTLFKARNFANQNDESCFRLTVDTQEDRVLVDKLINELGSDKPWVEYIDYLKRHPETAAINSQYARNEGYLKSLRKD